MRHRPYMFQHEGPDGPGGRLPWDAPSDLADRMRTFVTRAKAKKPLFDPRPAPLGGPKGLGAPLGGPRPERAAAVAEDSR